MRSRSFLIPRVVLSEEQENLIVKHIDEGKKYGLNCEKYNEWVVEFTDKDVFGCTCNDSFDMQLYFSKIGINDALVTWGDGI